MKRIIVSILLVLFAISFQGCEDKEAQAKQAAELEQLKIQNELLKQIQSAAEAQKSADAQKAKRNNKKQADKNACNLPLHASLAKTEGCRLVAKINGAWIRIDYMGDEKVRLALWKQNSKMSEKPESIVFGAESYAKGSLTMGISTSANYSFEERGGEMDFSGPVDNTKGWVVVIQEKGKGKITAELTDVSFNEYF